MRSHWTVTIGVLVSGGMVCTACASEGDGRTEITAAFEIESVPLVSVGLLEGDTLQEFHEVVTPFVLSDGRLVVPVSGASVLRVFGSTGAFLQNLGGPGAGPGEFGLLLAAWARSDTIEALDYRFRKIIRFLPDGSLQEVRLHTDLPDISVAAGPFGGGWAIAGVMSGGAGYADEIQVRHILPDGSDGGEIARTTGMTRYRSPFLTGPEPLSTKAVVTVSQGRVYVGQSDEPVITGFSAAGSTAAETRWAGNSRSVTRELWQSVMDSALAASAPARREALRRHLELAEVPDQLSIYWKLIVGDEGLLWIRLYEPYVNAFALGGRVGSGGRWLVLDPDGTEIGFAVMPSDLEPFQITSSAVVGIARDELGVESVRVHTLRRPETKR